MFSRKIRLVSICMKFSRWHGTGTGAAWWAGAGGRKSSPLVLPCNKEARFKAVGRLMGRTGEPELVCELAGEQHGTCGNLNGNSTLNTHFLVSLVSRLPGCERLNVFRLGSRLLRDHYIIILIFLSLSHGAEPYGGGSDSHSRRYRYCGMWSHRYAATNGRGLRIKLRRRYLIFQRATSWPGSGYPGRSLINVMYRLSGSRARYGNALWGGHRDDRYSFRLFFQIRMYEEIFEFYSIFCISFQQFK